MVVTQGVMGMVLEGIFFNHAGLTLRSSADEQTIVSNAIEIWSRLVKHGAFLVRYEGSITQLPTIGETCVGKISAIPGHDAADWGLNKGFNIFPQSLHLIVKIF